MQPSVNALAALTVFKAAAPEEFDASQRRIPVIRPLGSVLTP